MVNQPLQTDSSEKCTTIKLKKNNNLLKEQIFLAFCIQAFYDFVYIYLTYNLFTDTPNINFVEITLVIVFGLFMLYNHYSLRKNRKWLKNTNETLFISKNSIVISKKYFDKELARKNIDTQGIIKIFYQPWSIAPYPPYLPDYDCGCVHIKTYEGDTIFGINLSEQEGHALIKELIPLIMQYHEPKNYIFAELFQKEISQIEEETNPN